MIRLERNSRDVGRRGCAEMTAKAIDRRIAIDISERSADWRAVLRRRRAICNSAARAALAAAPFGWMAGSAGLELCIVLGDDPLLRRLNRQWRGQDRPTNVLSFAAQDPARISAVAPPQRGARRSGALLPLGDVVLAFGTIAGEAAAQGKTLADHLSHLVVHGVLHLLGLDHEDAAAAARMEALEIEVLAGIGVANPYLAVVLPRQARHG